MQYVVLSVSEPGWDRESFETFGSAEGDGASGSSVGQSTQVLVGSVDKAVQSPMFWAYSHFLVIVAGSIEKQSSFCEGCSCHESQLLQGASWQQRQRRIAQELGHGEADRTDAAAAALCPLKGRRAHELASGVFDEFVEEVVMTCKSQVVALSLRVSGDMRTQLMQDCYGAADLILSTIRLKTRHWCTLPWKLRALAADDPEVARKHGREAIAMFQEAQKDARTLLGQSEGRGDDDHQPSAPSLACRHYISRLFLSPAARRCCSDYPKLES